MINAAKHHLLKPFISAALIEIQTCNGAKEDLNVHVSLVYPLLFDSFLYGVILKKSRPASSPPDLPRPLSQRQELQQTPACHHLPLQSDCKITPGKEGEAD